MSSNPNEKVSPEKAILERQPGYMIHGFNSKRVNLLVREESSIIASIPTVLIAEIRMALFKRAGLDRKKSVGLVPCMVQLSHTAVAETGLLYESFFDYKHSDSKYLPLLARQVEIPVVFYGDSLGVERTICIPNMNLSKLKEIIGDLNRMELTWSGQDFAAAKKRLYADYPKINDLWEAMK